MTRAKVYICGPISKGDLAHNLNRATAAFVALAKAGLAPHCPHWSAYSKPAQKCFVGTPAETVCCFATVSGNDVMTHADWLGIDLEWVRAADAVLRLPGESVGADREVAEAIANDIPVFHEIDDVVRWSRGRTAAA